MRFHVAMLSGSRVNLAICSQSAACFRNSSGGFIRRAQASLSLEFQWPFMGEKSKTARQARAIAASASFACRAARVYLCDKRAVDRDQVLSCRSRSGTDPPVTVNVRLAAGGLTRPGRRNGTPICPRGGGRMEPSGKDGRGGEVSLAAAGQRRHAGAVEADDCPCDLEQRPTASLSQRTIPVAISVSGPARPTAPQSAFRQNGAGSAPAARRTWTVTGGSVPDRDRQRACRINTRAARQAKLADAAMARACLAVLDFSPMNGH